MRVICVHNHTVAKGGHNNDGCPQKWVGSATCIDRQLAARYYTSSLRLHCPLHQYTTLSITDAQVSQCGGQHRARRTMVCVLLIHPMYCSWVQDLYMHPTVKVRRSAPHSEDHSICTSHPSVILPTCTGPVHAPGRQSMPVSTTFRGPWPVVLLIP